MIRFAIYVIDDEQTIREGIQMSLEEDYQVSVYSEAETAIDAMDGDLPDLVLLDIGLPGMNGIEALAEIKRLSPDILVIMITAFEDINTVISAMKLGAFDYVVKPLHMDGLAVTIQNALETIRLKKEVQALQEKYLEESVPCFIGESNTIQDIMNFIRKVAQSPDTPVLILGETGTGKELIASAIHYRSPNFKGPFMPVNCAAIPKDLVESELFGYEKGAFSGARVSGKKGLIEEAAGGTLFLDEVGDLSLDAQAKLLRFLEEGEFYRIGGTKKIQIQTRLVSATNKDLENMMADELFRKDLYFRLGVIKVQIPSLNDRAEDILLLAKHFMFEFSSKFEKTFNSLSPQAEKALTMHKWTGHVRELKNMIERGVLIGRGPQLDVADLGLTTMPEATESGKKANQPVFPSLSAEGIDLSAAMESMEKTYIEEALKLADGNESKAARLLKINHHTFRYRRKKLFSA
jgi:DNA-binding NtrC family response regulator